jgi:hypothetical protein
MDWAVIDKFAGVEPRAREPSDMTSVVAVTFAFDAINSSLVVFYLVRPHGT